MVGLCSNKTFCLMFEKLKVAIIHILLIFQKEVPFSVGSSLSAISGLIFQGGQSLRTFLNSPGNWLSAGTIHIIVSLFL